MTARVFFIKVLAQELFAVGAGVRCSGIPATKQMATALEGAGARGWSDLDMTVDDHEFHRLSRLNSQVLIAAVIGGGAVALWHWRRGGTRPKVHASENRDVNLDIGEQLDVTEWQADGNGSASYRGARWSVRNVGSGGPQPGRHVIRRVEGSRLHVERLP